MQFIGGPGSLRIGTFTVFIIFLITEVTELLARIISVCINCPRRYFYARAAACWLLAFKRPQGCARCASSMTEVQTASVVTRSLRHFGVAVLDG